MFMSLSDVNQFIVLDRTALPNTECCTNIPYVQKLHRKNSLAHKFSFSDKKCEDTTVRQQKFK